MAHSIGKTIAKLRKEKGWTQAELAEKLQVSYKAVSKWEIEDSFPSIEFFPVLAQLFDVSIDYLMTGKIENVNLDDMDATKRIHYLIENDDLDNFKKYKCTELAIPRVHNGPCINETVWKAILENSANSIFSFCCDELNNALQTTYHRNQNYNCQDVFGYYIRNFADAFIKGVVDLDRSDILEAIGFRYFAVGEAPAISRKTPEKNPFQSQYNIETPERVETPYAYWIKKETIKYFFENREKSPKCFGYVTTIKLKTLPAKKQYYNLGYTFAHIYKDIEEYAIEYGHWDILENMLKVYDEELNNSALATSSSVIYKRTYVFSDYDRTRYIIGRIIPFSSSTITKLLDLSQIDLCRKLIAHNKKAGDVLTKMRSSYAKPEGFFVMTDSEIERYLQLHSDIPEDEKTVIRCIKDGIIIPDEVKRLDNLKLVRKILDIGYYNYFEIACECYKNNNYRKLYELLVDLNYSGKARELIYSSDEGRVSIVRNLFNNFASMPNALDETLLRTVEREARGLSFGLTTSKTPEAQALWKLECEKYVIVKMYEYILAQKEALYEFVNQKIEERLKAQRDAEERAKIVKGLDKEYFENLLSKNETRLFVLDLCSLFDAILKFDLKCEGEDFFSRMTTYFNNGPKSQSCDDGWGYYVLDTKHEEEVVIPWNKKKELFNRLRIQRNNIAHSESKPVHELSHEELRECLLFVMSINKEEK